MRLAFVVLSRFVIDSVSGEEDVSIVRVFLSEESAVKFVDEMSEKDRQRSWDYTVVELEN